MQGAGRGSAGAAAAETERLLRQHGVQRVRRVQPSQLRPGRRTCPRRVGGAAAVAAVRRGPGSGVLQPRGAPDTGQLLREGVSQRGTGLLLQVSEWE